MYRGGRQRQSLGTLLFNSASSSTSSPGVASVPNSSATLNFPISSNTEILNKVQHYQQHTRINTCSTPTIPFQSNTRRTPTHFQSNSTPTHFPSRSCSTTPTAHFQSGNKPSALQTLRNNPLNELFNFTSSKNSQQKKNATRKSSSCKSVRRRQSDVKKSDDVHCGAGPSAGAISGSVARFNGGALTSGSGAPSGQLVSTNISPLVSTTNGHHGSVCCDMCESGYDSERTLTVCRCGFSWRKKIRKCSVVSRSQMLIIRS